MANRVSDSAQSQNIRQLSAFRQYWSASSNYPGENHGNDHVHMPVTVIYEWADGRSRMEFSSEFRAYIGSGPKDGMIDIDDSAKVRIEDFHLRFNPAFQTYRFDKAQKTLSISDTSPKMGGRYCVIIRPAIEEPTSTR